MSAARNIRRPKRRRDTASVRTVTIGGTIVIILLAVLGWQALRVYNGVPGRDYSTIYVSTPQVGNLLSHDQVRIAGARVGQILKRDVGADGKPRIELQIEPGTDIPSDTKVAVRGAGLLGARYIELIPGTSPEPLDDGATLRGTDASYTFGLPEALDTFDRETRGALGHMVGSLGQGFLGNGERLNDGIHAAATRGKPFGQFARTVLAREGAAQRLIPALDAAVAPLDAKRREIADLTTVGADVMDTFIEHAAGMRETLDVAPDALTDMRSGLNASAPLLASLRGAADQASVTLADAPRGLRSLRRLLRDARTPLRRTSSLLDAAVPAVPGALRITDAADPVLKPAKDLVDDGLVPILRETLPYECDIVNFGTTMRSMTGYTQPGSGVHGPAQAFRLQIIVPLSTDVVGIKDNLGFNKREGVVEPCKYLAKPYPQFIPGSDR